MSFDSTLRSACRVVDWLTRGVEHMDKYIEAVNEMMEECHFTASMKGWHKEDRGIPEAVALMHSELSEALEEYRAGRKPSEIHYTKPKYTWWDRLLGRPEPKSKPEGIAAEYADVIIRIFDDACERGIPLATALVLKMEYNKHRPYRHGGKVC